MPTLVIGKTGQLARALIARLPDAVALGRGELDLASDPDTIRAALNEVGDVDGVILAAAYTAVDAAEDDEATALAVNGRATGEVARWCAERGVPLVHISTDYVFDGSGDAPLSTDAPVDPINAYGRSKRAGEVAVLESGANAAVLRTSWVYDGTGKNFLTTMLRLAETRDELNVVDDQIGRPTYAGDLAEASIAALDGLRSDPARAGIYHVSNTGEAVSWAGFADAIFKGAGAAMTVHPIPASQYPTPAARPAWSVMDTGAFEAAFGHALPEWRDGLDRALAER